MSEKKRIVHWCFDEVVEDIIPDNGGPPYFALECLHQVNGEDSPLIRGFLCNSEGYPLHAIKNHFSRAIEPLEL